MQINSFVESPVTMVYSDAQRRFYAAKQALTPAEKELISFYEMQWHLRHHVPTVEEVHRHLLKRFEKIKLTSVNYYLQRQPVIKALKQRGIPFEQHTQNELTQQQIAVGIVMSNFTDTRNNKLKLDSLGINLNQYNTWLKDPTFRNFMESQANENLINIKPVALTELTKKISDGDWNAVKFYLETTGAVQPSNAPQSEVMLQMLIEVLQRHIKDPELMSKIATDLLAVSGNRTLEVTAEPYVVPGEFIEDVPDKELEQAKKMLGFG